MYGARKDENSAWALQENWSRSVPRSRKCYSNHVCDTVDATLSEMESRWYDSAHTMTEAEKMVNDYNNGIAIFDSIELPDEQTINF